MSKSTRSGAAVAAVLAAVLAGAPTAQAVSWSTAPSHGGESAPPEAPAGEDHAGHGDHGAATPEAHDEHGVPAAPGPDEHEDHGASGSPPGGEAHDDHDAAGSDHGEESGGGHESEPDTVAPETRRLVLSGFGGLNASVLTAALLFRLRDRRTGTPLRSGRRAQR